MPEKEGGSDFNPKMIRQPGCKVRQAYGIEPIIRQILSSIQLVSRDFEYFADMFFQIPLNALIEAQPLHFRPSSFEGG